MMTAAEIIAVLQTVAPETPIYLRDDWQFVHAAKITYIATQDSYLNTTNEHQTAVAQDTRGRSFYKPEEGWTVSAYPLCVLTIA